MRASSPPLRIAVIGGSLTGCTAAIELARGGFDARGLMCRLASEHRVAAVSGDAFGLDGHVLRLSTGMVDAAALARALQQLFGGIAALLAAA